MPHLHFENYTFNYYKYDYGQNWFNKLQLFTTICENKIIFSPYAIKAQIYDSVNVLKQRGVEVEIDCNFTTPASYLISSPGNTEGKKTYFLFHIYQSQFLLSVSLTGKSAHCHTAAHSIRAREVRRLHPEARQQSHRNGEKRPDLLPL